MRLSAVLAVVVVACTPPPSQVRQPHSSPDGDEHDDDNRQNSLGMKLNDVQLDCRSNKMLDIGQLNKLFGARCDRNTMSIALNTFDLGSFDGFREAFQLNSLMTQVCMCKASPCRQDMTDELQRKVRALDRDRNKAEREGVLKMTNTLANHDCLEPSIGVEIYKSGYTCGLIGGGRSELLRKHMEEGFVKVFADDEEQALRLAASCWAASQPPDAGD